MDKKRVATIREGLGLSHEELGELLGFHRTTVQRWERGEWDVPRAAALAMESLKRRPKARAGA